MRALTIISLLTLVSCSSSMVQSARNKPKFAPEGYNQRGVVKYLNNGADHLINMRREDAFEKAHEDCGGKYKVTFEGSQKEGLALNPNMFGGYSFSGSDYVFIEYQCIQEPEALDIGQ